ncbi:MAG: hypothetical protein HY706_19520 [Candidatus Hydrogenedentes bacterium]|nr:hypothetical protein [Candidatus Hydrogenedentota bacterium]
MLTCTVENRRRMNEELNDAEPRPEASRESVHVRDDEESVDLFATCDAMSNREGLVLGCDIEVNALTSTLKQSGIHWFYLIVRHPQTGFSVFEGGSPETGISNPT